MWKRLLKYWGEKKMENRIDKKFQALQAAKRQALIPFVVAGDPNPEATKDIVLAMVDGGADIIELGIPYADPLADGTIIQAAAQRSLAAGTCIQTVLELAAAIRQDTEIPLILLVYFNSIFKYGQARFIKNIVAAGVDGIIVPDLPLEERTELAALAKHYGINMIPLAAPTSGERIARIVNEAQGFVYCVSSMGVTGMRQTFHNKLQDFMDEVKEATALPRAIGFGISGPESIKKLKHLAEGFIVGSAIVKQMESSKRVEEMREKVYDFVLSLRKALDQA